MNHPLSNLLAGWQPAIPEFPAFRRNVWRRIATSEGCSKSGFFLWVESFLISISQPRIAIVAACVAVVVGVAVGSSFSAHNESNASTYLRSVNPYALIASRL